MQGSPLRSAPKDAPLKPKIGLGDIAYGAMAVQLSGGLLFVIGIALRVGRLFGFFHPFPFAAYACIAIGAAVWGVGQNMD